MAKLTRVLIVGGGSSGWMTAALLRKRLGPEIEVALVEASDIPIIGVGESTNPVMVHFQRMLGLDEKAMMRASNGAFKVGIRFENFGSFGRHFLHAFGIPENVERTFFRGDAQTFLASFHVAEQRKFFSKECAYSYQIDAGLYGQFLKLWCKARGVKHIVDKVLRVELAGSGEIARIHTEGSGPLQADLYVDCSGFRSLLLGATLKEPFISCSKYLINDRAIAARVPYLDKDDELKVYTNCTAVRGGWIWNIPLWSRIGTGYVYSSAFSRADEAESEYRRFLGEERVKDLSFNHIEIRTGRHERAWVGNCVAIGISHGFLEPLESTGLSLTQVSIIDLADALSGGVTSAVERETFNRRVSATFDATRDFIIAHYVLTTRDDTDYWRHIQNDSPIPDSLADVLIHARRKRFDVIARDVNPFYGAHNWNLVLSGMGFFDREAQPDENGETSATRAAKSGVPKGTLHARFLKETVYEGEYAEPPTAEEQRRDLHPMWNPTW